MESAKPSAPPSKGSVADSGGSSTPPATTIAEASAATERRKSRNHHRDRSLSRRRRRRRSSSSGGARRDDRSSSSPGFAARGAAAAAAARVLRLPARGTGAPAAGAGARAGRKRPAKGAVEDDRRPPQRTSRDAAPSVPNRSAGEPRQEEPPGNKPGGDGAEESRLGAFFKRGSKQGETGNETPPEPPKSIPIVGRFFSVDEEKEEKKRIKKERKVRNKEEKRERQKQQKMIDDDDDYYYDKKRNKIIPSVKNYFRDRQIRKDAEVLRFQVKRMEEDRQKQLDRDAEELRLAVRQREEERQKQKQQQQAKPKTPTPPVVVTAPNPKTKNNKTKKNNIAPEDMVRRKIQTQKEIDRQRKERLEKVRSERGTGVPSEDKRRDDSPSPSPATSTAERGGSGSGGSKSQRFGIVVSAAQKLVAGVFEGTTKAEEWIVVAPKTRISPGEIVAVTAAGIDLLLIASKDGSAVHCVANSCPHLGTPLEVGSLERLPIEPGSSPPASSSSSTDVKPLSKEGSFFKETDISRMLKQDGCEDCIVCPLHKTAFALESGEVRGEWCPYPPVIGKLTGTVKKESNLPVFDVRTRGKNIEVRLNTPVEIGDDPSGSSEKR
eukprot:CAMPEP_0201147010 /NCGR_PEP_ID=MMETSP0851-20130426/8634_1 /ASSEMBLY_ACC=CAM_ASM_000631 /TAXON_ID=183588 /ORGANISM="Pseudo-nitzschia fraudulenta, Strain WWA7" /LENGTH=606 /DNA_ID=CAMNT_0047422749 /DNA_START=244 /DNA_END=2064 /DNA_ORIENTATION=+